MLFSVFLTGVRAEGPGQETGFKPEKMTPSCSKCREGREEAAKSDWSRLRARAAWRECHEAASVTRQKAGEPGGWEPLVTL